MITSAKMAMKLHTSMTALSPNASAAGAKRDAPTKAPNLPAAAQIPLKVDRQGLVKTSEGRTKVVVLTGPPTKDRKSLCF